MKKILIIFIFPLILYSNEYNYNYQNMSEYKLGININNLENTKNGVYLGYDFMLPTKISFGIGFEVGSFNNYTNYTNYDMDINIKAGINLYDYIHYPLKFKIGIGMNDTYYNVKNNFGLSLMTNISMPIYKSFGVGIQYKKIFNQMDHSQISIYANISF